MLREGGRCTYWMKELREIFLLATLTFWHEGQIPDQLGLILGQIPQYMAQNSSEIPGYAREGIGGFGIA